MNLATAGRLEVCGMRKVRGPQNAGDSGRYRGELLALSFQI